MILLEGGRIKVWTNCQKALMLQIISTAHMYPQSMIFQLFAVHGATANVLPMCKKGSTAAPFFHLPNMSKNAQSSFSLEKESEFSCCWQLQCLVVVFDREKKFLGSRSIHPSKLECSSSRSGQILCSSKQLRDSGNYVVPCMSLSHDVSGTIALPRQCGLKIVWRFKAVF